MQSKHSGEFKGKRKCCLRGPRRMCLIVTGRKACGAGETVWAKALEAGFLEQ